MERLTSTSKLRTLAMFEQRSVPLVKLVPEFSEENPQELTRVEVLSRQLLPKG